MNAPIAVSMGMEKLECEFTLGSYSPDILVAWEVREGSNIGVTLREVLEDYDGTQRGATHVMRGKIIEIDNGTLKAGDKASMKVKMALKYYKATHNGVTKQEIDVENMVQIAGGVDALATTRGILGI
jgi:P2 family phage contractile tail tube protein